jgi:hypothetical protein
MITVVRIDNPFEPYRRETSDLEFKAGMTTDDVCEALSVKDLVAGSIAHNGQLLDAGSCRYLKDGDFVTVAISPGGPEVVELFTLLVKAFFVGKIAAALMPKMDVADDVDSNYGYYGFTNKYLPEGSPVPVVYGTMRTAPPCVNQSILGGSADLTFGSLVISGMETLNTMLAVSEGPIAGIGDFVGAVSNDTELDSVVNGADIPTGLGVLINGIPSQALTGVYRWRTGEQYQESLQGDSSFVDYSTSPSTTYALGQKITVGTDGIDGSSGQFPSGAVTYSNRIIDTDATQYVSQQLSEKTSLANIQFFFDKGLYSGGSSGNPGNNTVTMRVQYWPTDSGGTATGKVMILPPVVVTNNLMAPFSADYKFELFDTDTVTAPEQGGFWNNNTQGTSSRRYMRLMDSTGLSLVNVNSGSFYGCAWLKNIDQKQGGGSSYRSPMGVVYSWGNYTTEGTSVTMPQTTISGILSGGTDHEYAGPTMFRPGSNVVSGKGWAFVWSKMGYNAPAGTNSQGSLYDHNPDSGHGLVLCFWNNNSVTRWHTGTIVQGIFINSGWMHVGFSYKKGEASDGSEDSCTFFHNGISYAGTKEHSGSLLRNASCPQASAVFSIGNMLRGNATNTETTPGSSCRNYMQGAVLATGSPVSGFFDNAANQMDSGTGGFTFRPKQMASDANAKILIDGFTATGSASAGASVQYYTNWAVDSSHTTEAQGVPHLYLQDTGHPIIRNAPQTESAMWSSTSGTPSKGFYKIEVFKDFGAGPFDEPDKQNIPTVDSITTFASQDFTYPGTAIMAVSLTANEEVNNSQPSITALVKGVLVPVWDGESEDNPTMTREFRSNPAWIALDMLTNRRYGMGDVFAPNQTYELIDLSSFKEWADYCDEGVADGFGTLTVFGVDTTGDIAQDDSDLMGQRLYIGLVNSGGDSVQTLPDTWRVGSTVSIVSTSEGVPDWKTSDDAVGGLHDASNLLEIHKITSFTADDFHGWDAYVRVDIICNDTTTRPGDTRLPYWADEITNSTTSITETLTTTDTTLDVDDVSIFSSLDYNAVFHYATITVGSNTETVQVYGYDVANSRVTVYRAQFGDTALSGTATIGLRAGDSIATVSGYETRCSFDGVFDQKKTSGWDALLTVFQAGRAMPVKAGSKIIAVVDKPRDPVALFGQGNIKEGSFGLTYMSAEDKPNSLSVQHLDKDFDYERRTVIIDHPSTHGGSGVCSIDIYSDELTCLAAGGTWTADDNTPTEFATRRSESLDARGVVRRSQATRDATYRLNRYHLQRRAASFEVGPDAIHLLPGDRILVSHDTPQYGFSGRIPEGGSIANLYPSGGPATVAAPSLYQSFASTGDGVTIGDSGGPLWRGSRTLATTFQSHDVAPPIAAYSQAQLPDGLGVCMYRNSIMSGDATMPAGLAAGGSPTACFDQNKASTGGASSWTGQFGYPTDGDMQNNGVDIDVIASTTHKSCFSVYVKEPAKGAARGMKMNIYRRFNEDLVANSTVGLSKSYSADFRWVDSSGTSTLTTTGLSMAAAMSQSVESIGGGWWRATTTVNWADITDITPATAVGWHIQPRIYVYDFQDNGSSGYDGVQTRYGLWKGVTVAADGNSVTWTDDDTIRRGRGNNFLAYGDPLKINSTVWDGDANGTATDAWSKLQADQVSGSNTANNLWALASPINPFYPESHPGGTEEQGKYGYVHGFYGGKTGAANYLSATQIINLNQTTSSGLAGGANWAHHFERFNGREGYGDFEDEPMILSFFFKKGRNGNVETKFEARLMFNNSVDSNGHANGDYAAVEITIPASSGDPTFSYTLNNASGAANPGTLTWAAYSYGGNATYAAKVRQNSTTNDSDWYYVRIAAVNNTNFRSTGTGYSGHLGVQFIMGATGGANATTTGAAQIWGVKLRGLAGDSKTEGGAPTTVRYYTLDDTGRYRGLELWGPMYETGTETASTYGTGVQLKLDRDVTLDSGKNYEVLVRQSGADIDPILNTDLQQVLAVSANEIPSSGSKVIPARTTINTATTAKFLPSTGDIYSFGVAGKATEDFTITSIDTDPSTLVRTIECVEYHESIYNDTQWGVLGDPTVSALAGSSNDASLEYAMGGGSEPEPENLSFEAFPSGYRGPSGEPIPGVWLRWGYNNNALSYESVNIWVSQLNDTAEDSGFYRESAPQLVKNCPATHSEYRYDGPALNPSRQYKFRLQPVGQRGTARALRKCPSVIVTAVTNAPLPVAPTVAASLFGKKQMYKVAAVGTERDYAIEGRIGGWIVSTPAFIIDPNTDRFVSEGLLPVPTNDAGSTQAIVVARPKLLNGSYGNAKTVTGTEAIVDVRATRQVIAENNYSAVQSALGTELQLVTGTTDIVQWNSTSTSVAEQIYRMTEIDATTPRRTVINAIIEGYQERPETFGDFGETTLGSEIGRNWSIEGPMKDDGYNGSVKIEWRWTSGSSITGVDFRPFEPGEIYARKVQFRILFNRAAITGLVAGTGYAQTKVTRFTIIENDQPDEHFVDGGTF